MTEQEINAAADKLLAEAGEEKVRNFCVKYANEEERSQFFRRTRGTTPVQLEVQFEPGWDAPISAATSASKRNFRELLISQYGVEAGNRVADQVDRYVDGSEYAAKVAAFEKEYLSLLGPNETPESDAGKLGAYCVVMLELEAYREMLKKGSIPYYQIVHEHTLAASLMFNTTLDFEVTVEFTPGELETRKFGWPTPLIARRRNMIKSFQLLLISGAAYARGIGSDAYRDWRDALVLLTAASGGPDASDYMIAQPFDQQTVDKLLGLFRSAREKTWADYRISCFEKEGAK